MGTQLGNSTNFECKLSDKGEALVTLYITAITTIVTTITNANFIESFILAWIAWLPFFRGAIGVGIYVRSMYPRMKTYIKQIFPDPKDDEQAEAEEPLMDSEDGYELGRLNHAHNTRRGGGPFRRSRWSYTRSTEYYDDIHLSVITRFTWWFWHTYIPYSQWTWFFNHRDSIYPGSFFARGTGVGLVLVAMSFDYRSRVISSAGLGPRGPFVALAMCILSVVVFTSLFALMSTEFVYTLVRNRDKLGSTSMDVYISIGPFGWETTGTNAVVVPIYIIFSAIWAAGSFAFVPGRDPGADSSWEPGFPGVPILLRPFAGLFFMCFTGAIPFMVYQSADDSNGIGVLEFAQCAKTWDAIEQLAF